MVRMLMMPRLAWLAMVNRRSRPWSALSGSPDGSVYYTMLLSADPVVVSAQTVADEIQSDCKGLVGCNADDAKVSSAALLSTPSWYSLERSLSISTRAAHSEQQHNR